MEQNINLELQTMEQSAQNRLLDWEVEWIRCKPYIERAAKHQDAYTIDDIEAKIRMGRLLLCPGKESAMITEFLVYPQHNGMNLLFCGGKYEELEEMYKHIAAVAKQMGVKRLYCGGRRGWHRKLKHLGFEKEYVLRKDL